MITPMDIHNKTFSRGLRGYSQEEVDAFLQELASDYERIYREHREMEEEMDTVKTKLRNYEKMESTMSSTLVMAQETAENVKRNAQKEAELAVREAQNEAHQIISDAEAARRIPICSKRKAMSRSILKRFWPISSRRWLSSNPQRIRRSRRL